jgi:NhaP-type Na+/H+ and K+/H+ antiporter
LFGSFKYRLELLLSVSVIYLIVILVWKPYHPIVSKHNYFLYLNHGSVAVFLAICLVFAYDPNIPETICIYLMYFVMVLLSLVIMGGFVRIFIEKSFRKNLERDPTLLEVDNKKLDSKNIPKVSPTPFAKKRGLLANNQYVF